MGLATLPGASGNMKDSKNIVVEANSSSLLCGSGQLEPLRRIEGKLRHMKAIKEGRLLEISPFGTGFIEDVLTGARYGFHVSMIEDSEKTQNALELDGKGVQFEVAPSGLITNVTPNFSSRI